MKFHYTYLVFNKNKPAPRVTALNSSGNFTVKEVKKRRETMKNEIQAKSKKIENFALNNEQIADHLGVTKDDFKKYLKRNKHFDRLLSDMQFDAGGSYSNFANYVNALKLKGKKVKLTEVYAKMVAKKIVTMRKLKHIRSTSEKKLDDLVAVESRRDEILQDLDDTALNVAQEVCKGAHQSRLHIVYNKLLKHKDYKSELNLVSKASTSEVKTGKFITKELKSNFKTLAEKFLEYENRPEVTSFGIYKKEGVITLIVKGKGLGGTIFTPDVGSLESQSHMQVGSSLSVKKGGKLDFTRMAGANLRSMIINSREELKFKMSEDLITRAASELVDEYAKATKEFVKKQLDNIEIKGYASQDGGFYGNKALSLKRAYAERDRVAKALGVNPKLIKDVKGYVLNQHGDILDSPAAARKSTRRFLSAYNLRFGTKLTMAEFNKKIAEYNRNPGLDREGYFKLTLGNNRRADVDFGLHGKGKKTPIRFNVSTSASDKTDKLTS